jgi:hypothetical protein
VGYRKFIFLAGGRGAAEEQAPGMIMRFQGNNPALFAKNISPFPPMIYVDLGEGGT